MHLHVNINHECKLTNFIPRCSHLWKKNGPISSVSYVYKFYLSASHYLSCVWKNIYSWMVSFIIEYYNIASINLFFVYYNYSMLIPFLKCNIMLYTYVVLSFFDTFFSFNFFFILCFANIYKIEQYKPFFKNRIACYFRN